MEYHSRFNLGDKVCAVTHDNFQRIVRCKPCANTGKLRIGDEDLICPKCNGRSTHTQYAGQKYYVSDFDTTVGKIQIEHVDPLFARVYNEDPPLKITYMLESTGVGTGRVWSQEDLFATEEQAKAFCDRQNGSLLPDETENGTPLIGRYGDVLAKAVPHV